MIVPEPIGRRKKHNRAWLWALFVLLLLGFALGAFLAFGKFWSLSEVAVPDVVNKQIDSARDILTNTNLRVSETDTFSDTIPANMVISQDPAAGTTVKEQRTIDLVVSKGVEVTVVPDVRGLNKRDAELQITNSGTETGPGC